jgi:hypothetical protein
MKERNKELDHVRELISQSEQNLVFISTVLLPVSPRPMELLENVGLSAIVLVIYSR